jgi:hypothetical protein
MGAIVVYLPAKQRGNAIVETTGERMERPALTEGSPDAGGN